MTNLNRIYLDNAATSWPKPETVYTAVENYQRHLGCAVGRSGYAEAVEVGRTIEAARATIAALMEAESQNQIIFTFNGTDSLNLAIHGLLKPGDHVVTSVVEHNSVLRPLRWLEENRDVGVTRVGCDPSGLIDPDEIRAVLRPETRLIVLLHASNVTGAIQPVAAVAEIAHEHGALFLVDAAQTLGHMPFSVKEIAADLVAAPGHKGLLGPLGTGILYLGPGIENKLACIRQGGTGSVSFEDHQPQSLPEKYESGNHNAPGLIGLGAAVAYLASRGLENVRNHERRLTDRLFAGLSTVPGIINHGPRASTRRIGVLSITLPGTSSLEVARALESTYRVQVRAGYHCAALIHRAIHTFETDGTVRFSIGPFNTESDIDAAIEAVRGVVRDIKRASQQVHVGCRCTAGNRTPEEEVVAAASVVEAPQGSPVALQIPGLDELWAQTLGDPRVCVAVLDGPVDLSHPSLANANLTRVETLVSDVAGGGAATQHGTHVTSIIFGQHDGPVPGIAPGCRGLIIPIYSDESLDSPRPCSQVDLARALLQALQAGANIINVSGGQFSPSGTAHPILADAVRACARGGALIVAAAGNQGCECLHIPGALPSVLAVGAMNALGQPLPFSNWGANYLAQGILAPGENILGANPNGRLTVGSGTSFATPIISGIAALLMSLQVKRGQKPDGATVRDALLRSALGCEYQESADCHRLLAGRLNIRGAISILLSGAHSMSDQIERKASTHLAEGPQIATPIAQGSLAGMQALGCHSDAAADVPQKPQLLPDNGISSAGRQLGADMGQIVPSACSCGGQGSAGQIQGVSMQLVYALGQLGVDFGTEARHDAIIQKMDEPASGVQANPSDPTQLLAYLNENPHDAASLIWTLNLDATPIYAVMPAGPYADVAFQRLGQFLGEQRTLNEGGQGVERVSIPGIIAGQVRLFNGLVVPVIRPEIRGMHNWKTKDLINAVAKALVGPEPKKDAPESEREAYETKVKNEEASLTPGVPGFLDRVYFELRNLGITPQERAVNYAATNALNVAQTFKQVLAETEKLELETIEVERSPVCRPDSDCWDVKLFFFFPDRQVQTVRKVYRFTVDVSDVVPVTVGPVRHWSVR